MNRWYGVAMLELFVELPDQTGGLSGNIIHLIGVFGSVEKNCFVYFSIGCVDCECMG